MVVDLRTDSPSYRQHVAVELTAANRPPCTSAKGLLAHGFQTLEDDTEVSYQMGERYTPGADRGVRHDDPALGIDVAAACVRHLREGHGLAASRMTAADVVVVTGIAVMLATAALSPSAATTGLCVAFGAATKYHVRTLLLGPGRFAPPGPFFWLGDRVVFDVGPDRRRPDRNQAINVRLQERR